MRVDVVLPGPIYFLVRRTGKGVFVSALAAIVWYAIAGAEFTLSAWLAVMLSVGVQAALDAYGGYPSTSTFEIPAGVLAGACLFLAGTPTGFGPLGALVVFPVSAYLYWFNDETTEPWWVLSLLAQTLVGGLFQTQVALEAASVGALFGALAGVAAPAPGAQRAKKISENEDQDSL